MKIIYKGIGALLLSIMALAALPILLDQFGSSIGTVPLLFYTFLISSPFSIFIAYAVDRMRGLKTILKSKSGIAIMGFAGILNFGMAQVLLSLGAIGTNANIAGLVSRSWVVMMALMIPLMLKQRVSRKQIVAIFIGFIGIAIVFLGAGVTGGTFSYAAMPYLIAIALSAFLTAFSSILVKAYNTSATATTVIFNVGSLLFITFLAVIVHANLAVVFTTGNISAVLFLGLVVFGLNGIAYFYAFRTLNPMMSGSSLMAVPFITILLSLAFLGTPIKYYYLLSGALLGISIIIQQKESLMAPKVANSDRKNNPIALFDVTSAFMGSSNEYLIAAIRGDGRSTAIKVRREISPEILNSIFQNHGCIVFDTVKGHEFVNEDEIVFIKDVLGVKSGDIAIVGIGKPKELENAFDELYRISPQSFTDIDVSV